MVPSRKRKKEKKKICFPLSLLSCQLFCLSLTVSLSIRFSASLSLLQILGLPLTSCTRFKTLGNRGPGGGGMNSRRGNPHHPISFLTKHLSLSLSPHTYTHSSDLQMFPTERPSAKKAQALRGSGQGPGDAESSEQRLLEWAGAACALL